MAVFIPAVAIPRTPCTRFFCVNSLSRLMRAPRESGQRAPRWAREESGGCKVCSHCKLALGILATMQQLSFSSSKRLLHGSRWSKGSCRRKDAPGAPARKHTSSNSVYPLPHPHPSTPPLPLPSRIPCVPACGRTFLSGCEQNPMGFCQVKIERKKHYRYTTLRTPHDADAVSSYNMLCLWKRAALPPFLGSRRAVYAGCCFATAGLRTGPGHGT